MIFENVLEVSLGECSGEVSLTGNEGAGRGRAKDDMVGSVTLCYLLLH